MFAWICKYTLLYFIVRPEYFAEEQPVSLGVSHSVVALLAHVELDPLGV